MRDFEQDGKHLSDQVGEILMQSAYDCEEVDLTTEKVMALIWPTMRHAIGRLDEAVAAERERHPKVYRGKEIADAPDGWYMEFDPHAGIRNYDFIGSHVDQREIMSKQDDRWVFGPLPTQYSEVTE